MLPQKPFYLIRHGQSEANVANITAGGGTDSKLTPLGHAQAKALMPYMSSLKIKPGHLYHSTMRRAYDTAMHLNAGLKLPTTPERDLREHEMGDWEGIPWERVLPQLEASVPPPNGETLGIFAQRIQRILTDIFNRTDEESDRGPPLIVAHGGLFFAMGALYGYGMMHVQNCHLHYFEPHAPYAAFPWKVSVFDIEGDVLAQKPAPFCVSQNVRKIAI